MAYNDNDQLEGLAVIIEGACKVPVSPHKEYTEKVCSELARMLADRGVDNKTIDCISAQFKSLVATEIKSRLIPDEHGQMTFNAAAAWLRETSAGAKFKPTHVIDQERREYIRARVCAEFNGRNVAELIERYSISRATVYRYLKHKRTGK